MIKRTRRYTRETPKIYPSTLFASVIFTETPTGFNQRDGVKLALYHLEVDESTPDDVKSLVHIAIMIPCAQVSYEEWLIAVAKLRS